LTRGRNLFSALAAVLMLAATASAQNSMIRGKVRSSSGTTVNNAIVELRMGGGAILSQTVTRNDGDFAFTNLQPAEYEILVNLAGYEPTVQLVRFNQTERMGFQEILRVEVTIKPKADAALNTPGTSFAQDVPRAARAAYEKALMKLREGKSDEAVSLLREATGLFNDYFDAHLALGGELLRVGKYEEALEALERARQINDRQAAVYYMFGLVMVKQQKFNVAEYAFREATRLDGASVASHFYRGMVLIELAARTSDAAERTNSLAEAEKELQSAWELSDKRLTVVYVQRARIHERRGDKEAAARELESYLRADPNAKNAAEIRAVIAKLRGEKK
jgi:Tfp pilus assembly protein PilF